MRAAIYNPYLDTLGGGERYTLSFAKVLADAGWTVDVEWKDPGILESLKERFGTDLSFVNIIPDVNRGDGYDLMFWVSDGSVPTLRARKNFLHFQVPFHDVSGKSLLNKMKFFRINKVICNSLFTKKVIDKEYGVDSIVVYPPVPVENIRPRRKENIILYVGRFSQLKQNKHQDILISNFKKIYGERIKDWKLVLAGGTEIGVGDYIERLKKTSAGLPVEIAESPDFKTLKELYGKSKIFWSASGFGENEDKSPENAEHFGITVAEAMAAGAVPVIYNSGGHKEIVIGGENGYLWTKEPELRKITLELIDNKLPLHKLSLNAVAGSKKFSYENFSINVNSLL